MQVTALSCLWMVLLIGGFGRYQRPLVETENELIDLDRLKGVWVYHEFSENRTCYRRNAQLPNDQYGFELKEGGKLLINQNSSRCGTIITYDLEEGTWKLEDDVLTLEYPYWGSKVEVIYEVTAQSADALCLGQIKRFYN
ncbi:hypothetical protein [Pontibacter sp. G13]|uniref:hypothetical protein n=1 Tax=Pontibacter sp. G13 TaxID=3074898 RepID=UPI00288BED74|nr:hypothetical protein [Pontibacter sp. G13]WNJ20063.1 hypothetical protein RJD25_06225 [Pontibacter sp. G13]